MGLIVVVEVEDEQAGEVSEVGRDPAAEVRVGEEEMCQAAESTDELRDRPAAEVVGREVQVLEMTQSEQGGAYLTSNGSSGHEFTFRVGVGSDLELNDVASPVAALNAGPPAAVHLAPP